MLKSNINNLSRKLRIITAQFIKNVQYTNNLQCPGGFYTKCLFNAASITDVLIKNILSMEAPVHT